METGTVVKGLAILLVIGAAGTGLYWYDSRANGGLLSNSADAVISAACVIGAAGIAAIAHVLELLVLLDQKASDQGGDVLTEITS